MQGEMNNIDEKTVTKTVVQCHRQCMELITWNEGGGGAVHRHKQFTLLMRSRQNAEKNVHSHLVSLNLSSQEVGQ